jgi:Family of unknown function (DUF6680)
MGIANFLAVLLSPLVAVLVSMWLQDRKERRQHQFQILGTLIATRAEPLSPEAVRALNVIDLVFHDKDSVRRLWREYFDMLNNQGLNNPQGFAQRSKKNLELITEMAKSLGYGRAISHLDVDRVYYPVGAWAQTQKNQEIQDELLRVLKSTARVEVQPVRPAPTELPSVALALPAPPESPRS